MPDLRHGLTTLHTGPFRWLLTLTIGGRVVRLTTGDSDQHLTVTGNDGELYEFVGGLGEVSYERLLDLWNASASPRSQSFEVFLDFDIAQAVARGVPVYAAEGELAQWYEGTSWEQRRRVLFGQLEEPVYGEQGDPFSFALSEDPGDDQALEPSPSKTVAEGVTFLESGNIGPDPGIIGAVYPTVIGTPGQAKTIGTTSTGGLSEEVGGTPALLVRRDGTGASTTLTDYRVLIAGHQVAATSVKIWNKTTGITWSATPQLARDLLGNVYSYVNPPSAGVKPLEGEELYAIWDPTTGGGLRNSFAPGTLRGAGDVIRWALNASTLRIDRSRLSELKALNGFLVDSHINVPSSPWSWVSSNLLPLLPVSVGTGPDGLFVVPWLHTSLRKDQAVDVLEHKRNCVRAGDVVYTSRSEVLNDLTIRFGRAADTGSYALRRRVSGDNYDSADPDSRPEFWCRRSRSLFGRRSASFDTAAVFDTATAEAMLGHLARRHSFPRRELLVTLGRDLDWLRPGDVVLYADTGLHLTEAIALVGSIGYGENNLTAQLVLFEPLVFEA